MQANHIGIIQSLMLVFICLKAIVAQNITNVQMESINCSHVVVNASIDPVSTTYTFSWELSINGGSDIELVLVGLDGNGNIGEIDQNSGFIYILNNDPSSLPNNNDPFTSRLTFMFVQNSFENLIFKAVSTPLDISIPEAVNKPTCSSMVQSYNVSCSDNSQNITCPACGGRNLTSSCNENAQFNFDDCPIECSSTDQDQDVSCSDDSEDCFCPESNIPAIITCPCGETLSAFCNENSQFNFSICPFGCPMTVQNLEVTCADGSQNCFYCNSNISASITCPCGENLTAICNESSQFNFSTCMSKPATPQQTVIPTTSATTTKAPISENSVSSGGAMNVIGIFAWVSTFCGPLLYLTDLTAVATIITIGSNF